MRASFLIYKSFYDPIKHLNNEHLGRLFRAIFEYQINGNEPLSTDIIYMPFLFFKNQFSLDQTKYSEKCERNSLNAKKRWDANVSDRMQTDANDADKDKDKDKENDKDNIQKENESLLMFDVFWKLYGKKVDKEKCIKAWKKIPKQQHAFVYERARLYVKSTPEVKYRKNPLTWLNGKCYNDEISEEKNTNGKYIPTL
jgi:hypothetical protein